MWDFDPSSLDDEESVDSARRRADAIFNESPQPKTNSSQSEEVKRLENDSGASS